MSEPDIDRLDRTLAILRQRFERWLRLRYLKLLIDIRKRLLAEGVPSEETIALLESEYSRKYEEMCVRFYETVYPAFAEFAIDDTVKSLDPPMMEVKRVLDIGILLWIHAIVGEHIRIINGYVPPLQDVRKMAVDAQGDPVRFKEAMDASGIWSTTGMEVRSRRVAVTETTIGMNNSMAKTSERLAMGRKRVKTWHTSGLRNVRESHRRMNGKTIDADDFFEVPVFEGKNDTGMIDLMKYPGDHSIPPHASNVVNCHCFCTYRYAK